MEVGIMPRRKKKKKKATQTRYHDRPFSRLEQKLCSKKNDNSQSREVL